MTRWRQRMGEEKLVALIQESLNVATRTGAAKPADFSKVIVDTTVQPKAAAFPTDAKLMHRARERLIRLAKKHGVTLRQSYERLGKRALIAHQRYAHAKQFKRANRVLELAIQTSSSVLGPAHLLTADIQCDYGFNRFAFADYAGARASLQTAADIYEKELPSTHTRIAEVRSAIALVDEAMQARADDAPAAAQWEAHFDAFDVD